MELSVDEAIAAGATDVRFSQPLPFYVENFLGFPVGIAVPTGFYDRQQGSVGRLGQRPRDQGAQHHRRPGRPGPRRQRRGRRRGRLAALGVTAEERRSLAQLYTPGQTLWRVPITHFTPWDCNWPCGAAVPMRQLPPNQPPPQADDPLDNVNEQCGSVIGCENQTLGESVPVTRHAVAAALPERPHARPQGRPTP